MRKHLMTGTALLGASLLVAGTALAADKKMSKPSISVNGYYEAVVGGVLDNTMETKRMVVGAGDDGDFAATADNTSATRKIDNKSDTSALDTKTDAEIHFNGRPRSTAA